MASALSKRGSTTRWRTLRAQILARDGYRCQLRLPGCLGEATEVDHIQTRHNGGGDQPHNLRASCEKCNGNRGGGAAVHESRW
jgi:5-methylcytosine-specific restriction protein A